MMKKRLLFILCLFFVGADASIAQNRTVTNADLEKFRQKRLQSEKEYRENYSKLGFPSPEELEKLNIENRRRLSELSQQIEAENADNQESFQERAGFLRTEIASVEAQIEYLRGELSSFPRQNLFFSSGYYSPYGRGGGYYNSPNGYARNNRVRRAPTGSFTAPRAGRRSNRTSILIPTPSPRGNYNAGSVGGFGISIVPGVGDNAGYGRQNYYNRNRRRSIYQNNYIAPYFNADRSYQRDEVAAQIRLLEQSRAGLYAEWQVLEDEARRAGVKID